METETDFFSMGRINNVDKNLKSKISQRKGIKIKKNNKNGSLISLFHYDEEKSCCMEKLYKKK